MRMKKHLMLVLCMAGNALAGNAQTPVSTDSTYRDQRFMELRKGENRSYTMPGFAALAKWQAYAAKIKQRILIATGLWPMPEKTPLNATRFVSS